jgi:nucleoside-diphosphate-sugar epimerase
MSKILITGASGFIGSSVLKKFSSKSKIYCLVRNIPKKKKKKVVYIKGDLFNDDFLNNLLKEYKFKFLMHIAWEATPLKFWNSKRNINFLISSTNLYYNFCKYGGKYALFIGSSAECNLKLKKIFEKEFSNNFILSRYSLSKILFYKNIKKISEIFNTQTLWARIFWIYGDNQNKGKLISDMINSLKLKKKFVIKNMFDSINLMHKEDVASAIVKLFKKKRSGIANIASNKNYKIKDIVAMIKDDSLRNLIIMQNRKKNYSFDKVNINNLKKINFREKIKINYKINELLS